MVDMKILGTVEMREIPSRPMYGKYAQAFGQVEEMARNTLSNLAIRLEFPTVTEAHGFTCAYRMRRHNHAITDAAKAVQRGNTVYIPGLAEAAPN